MITTAPSKLRLSEHATYLTRDPRPKPSPRQHWIIVIDFSGNSLKLPVRIDIVETTEGYWLATHPQIMVHGIGDTPSEAASDFMSAAREYLQELSADETRLAPHLSDELEYLRSIFVEAPTAR